MVFTELWLNAALCCWWWGYCETCYCCKHVDSWTVLDADQQVFTTSITYWGGEGTRLFIAWHGLFHGWASRVCAVLYFFPFYALALICFRYVSCLWFMSESMHVWCCRRETLTRESDWLSVLSIIKESYPIHPVHYPWAWRQEMRRPALMHSHWLSCSGPASRACKRVKGALTR